MSKVAAWWLPVLLLSACTDGATTKPTTPTVLALGDSIAFGYNPMSDKDDPTAFVSYGQLVAEQRGAAIVNLACAGETSGSLISRAAPDNGCGTWRQDHPLHFDYTSEVPDKDAQTIAQLDAAVAYLQDPAQPTPEVITLDIGANDLLLFAKQCPANDNSCLTGKIPELLQTVLPATQSNVAWILSSLRTEGGYDGPIVLMTTYALDYADADRELCRQRSRSGPARLHRALRCRDRGCVRHVPDRRQQRRRVRRLACCSRWPTARASIHPSTPATTLREGMG